MTTKEEYAELKAERALKILDGPGTFPEKAAQIMAAPPATASSSELRMLEDSPLADSLAKSLRAKLCSVPGRGWMRYDGKRWIEISAPASVEMVRLEMNDVAAGLVERIDPERMKLALKLLSTTKVKNVHTLLQGILERDLADFDAHPWFLNCGNGVVDLRSATLIPHSPDLLLSKITLNDFHPDANSDDWSDALEALPVDVQTWMQYRIGQAATGFPVPDDILPILQGGGSNGKTTMLSAMVAALGDHAVMVPEKVLMASANDHPTEMMTLQGARLALIEETPEGRHLPTKRLKDLVGATQITARKIRENNVTFAATHTLFLTSNYRPAIAETDHGTWRRLALVTFPFTFRPDGEPLVSATDRRGDGRLRHRLIDNKEGQLEAVLAWIVDGARAFYQDGERMYEMPTSVEMDTKAWRAESDQVIAYMTDRLSFEPTSSVLTSDLYEDFTTWQTARGQTPWGEPLFVSRFDGHGEIARHNLKKVRTTTKTGISRPGLPEGLGPNFMPEGKQRVWQGIRFIPS
jgi:putative DNA primase/helicase